jgi:diguanylate cyclase (GGDEF)-like protein/PAS domain S-box-containing protein
MKTPQPPKLSEKEVRQMAEARVQEEQDSNQTILSEVEAQKALHELQVHQIELMMQNEELQQARITERLHYRYTELFEFAPVAYFVFDASGVINQVNLRGASLLGVEPVSLADEPFSNYVTVEHCDIFKDCLNKVFEGEGMQSCEILVLINKTTRWMNIEANLGVTGTDCLAALTDVTDRKKTVESQKVASEEKGKRADELALANIELAFQNQEKDKRADELTLAKEEKEKRADELALANIELAFQNKEKDKRADELILAKEEKEKRADELALANIELAFQNKEKDKRADELILAKEEKEKRADELALANIELAFQNKEKDNRADELILANGEKEKRADELALANIELAFQNQEKDRRADELILANGEKEKRADELALANIELAFQNKEKDKRADELILANEEKEKRADELAFQNKEKDKRADELILANGEKEKRADELAFQNKEKDKRADELILANGEKEKRADELALANIELAFQNKEKDKRADELILANGEKEKRADELALANIELAFQNKEKDKRADELILANGEKEKRADELALANIELAFQNKEKDKRADELILANEEKEKRADELAFQNKEKDKRAEELILAKEEKEQRADELALANIELAFQNKEKDKRADELILANGEKEKRADELALANIELAFQNKEKDKRADELILAKEEKEKLADELALAAKVFTHAREGIMITDAQGNIIEVNDTFSLTTGYSREESIGTKPRIVNYGRQTREFYDDMLNAIMNEGYWSGEVWSRRKNGEMYAEIKTISAVYDEYGITTHYVALGSDITPMKEHQTQLEYIAHYDLLTNLPNRVLLADRLSQAMLKCNRHKHSLAVVFLDLDGFKAVNDAYGHDVGDELLIVLSLRMAGALRECDTLARIGGDEFVAVLADLATVEDCKLVVERLLLAASESVTVCDVVLSISASIGVTLYPQDNSDTDLLMRHADQAMYRAKELGKNCYHVFDTAIDDAVKVRQESLEAIRHALDNNEFVLYYQPKVNMKTGAVVGVEALIRWQHPKRGLLPPIEFLPVIESNPMMIEMGEWVIDTALAQIIQWQKTELKSLLTISVNIAAVQLQQPYFTQRLTALLAANVGVEPRYLELEVLETSALDDVHNISKTMNACNELGVSFALDDFGTGYSSLTYLRRLPASLIKIDQSFVRDMLVDSDDFAIVTGVIALAKSFNRDVIAEGVETIEHGKALLELGCHLAQGYGIARPMPANEILAWISNWKPHVSWQV